MIQNNKAAFSLENYLFDKVNLNFESVKNDSTLSVKFDPSGEYFENEGLYKLQFVFSAYIDDKDNSKTEDDRLVIEIRCLANFKFNKSIPTNEIPNFFYPNSIAILFPYVRAFVSTLTLQANIKPIMLPTLNLTSLQEVLKNNTQSY